MVEETVDMVTNPKVTEFPQALLVKWWRVWITELVPVSSQNTRRRRGDCVQASQQMLGCITRKTKQTLFLILFFFPLPAKATACQLVR